MKKEQTSKDRMIEFLESQEFYELMYSYRHTPFVQPDEVLKRFEEVKQAIKEKL
jgi:hypothetical protein